MIAVDQWTGQRATVLRDVLRMSIRDFSRRTGISQRTVSRWSTNGATPCSHVSAQVLDRMLADCSDEEQLLFRSRMQGPAREIEQNVAEPGPFSTVIHKFFPVWMGSGVKALLDGAPSSGASQGLGAVPCLSETTSRGRMSLHAYGCGVVIVHMESEQQFDSITQLAVWRYASYASDRLWIEGQLNRLLSKQDLGVSLRPEYVLSAYELSQHVWSETSLPVALQLLATPSVLVDRQGDGTAVPLGAEVERTYFTKQWSHPDSAPFSGATSLGVAAWSGVAYWPAPSERALATMDIIRLELDVQALWCLSAHILRQVEAGTDPVMPDAFGWRYLRGAAVRLNTAGPTETAQHRAMREAILSTSGLPERLRAAQDALRESA